MDRVVALASADVPCSADRLSDRIRKRGNTQPASEQGAAVAPMSLQEMETQLISSVLHHTGGNRTRAAEILGISREGLRTKLQRLQVSAEPDPIQ
jgi:DNA-binding protein Fis